MAKYSSSSRQLVGAQVKLQDPAGKYFAPANGSYRTKLACAKMSLIGLATRPKCKAVTILAGLLLLVMIVVQVDCTDSRTDDNGQRREQADGVLVSPGAEPDGPAPSDDQMMSTKQPRQQFRVHLGPMREHKRSLKLGKQRRAVGQKQQQTDMLASGGGQPEHADTQKVSKKISSAMLKKLLNQSLPKYSGNGTSSSSSVPKGSNFKFVFIQRATAAPSSLARTNSTATKKAPTGGAPSTQQPSLAASVSKQLANSLLYSATNLVGNLTASSAPSISLLASQVSGARPATISTPAPMAPSTSTTTTTAPSSPPVTRLAGVNDISRLSQTSSSPAKTKQAATKKSRPSRVYNLPVKFMSNGQPNSVVLQTIRQHFATIKKLQQSAAAKTSSGTKRKNQHQHNKMKSNSRLIYLPLKYLSNARPNMIISAKASHKSLPSSSLI